MMKNIRKSEGITIISLVVTIIVLIIITGVSINLLVQDNGVLDRTERERNIYTSMTAKDTVEIMLSEYKLQRGTDNSYLDTYLADKKTNGKIDDYAIIDSKTIEIQVGGYLVTANLEDFSIKEIRSKNPELQKELEELANSNIPQDAVAKYNGKYYNSLKAAIEATKNSDTQQIVILLKDTSENVLIDENKTILLYLNEKTIANSENKATITVNGVLELQEGSITGTFTEEKIQAILVNENAELYLQSTNVDINSEETYKWETITNNGKLSINHSKVNNPNSNALDNNGNLEISNESEITTTNSSTIFNEENGNLTITGGTVSSTDKNAISNKGKIKIVGGTISSENNNAIYNQANANLEAIGGKITVIKTNAINNYGNITINGNVQISSTAEKSPTLVNQSGGIIIVKIGTITSATSQAIWNKEGGTLEIEDGQISSESGIAIYNQSKATIVGGTISSKTSATLYNTANGNIELTGGRIFSESSNTINNLGKLDISGSVKIESTAQNYPTIAAQSGSNIKIRGGIITAVTSYGVWNKTGASLEITGGTITSESSYSINNQADATAEITGGNISSINNTTITNYGSIKVGESAKIKSTSASYVTFINTATGKVEISGGDIYAENSNVIKNLANGEIEIKGGTIHSGNNSAVWNLENGIINMTGGNISTAKGYGFKNEGTLTVSGGNISSETGYAIYNQSTANATLTGGELSSVKNVLGNYGTMEVGGSAIVNSEAASSPTLINFGTGILTIKGGTISAKTTYAVWNKAGGNITISGGTVSSKSSCSVYNESTANTTISGGNLSSISSQALRNYGILGIEGTVQIKSQAGDSSAVINYDGGQLTLSGGKIISTGQGIDNLQGATLSMTGGTIESSTGIDNRKGATATILGGTITTSGGAAINNSGSEEIGGTVQISAEGFFAIVNQVQGSLTISGGRIYSVDSHTINNAGTLLVDNGTITATNKDAIRNNDGTLTVNGGTITATNGYGINNSESGTVTINGGTISSKNNC